MSTGAWVAIAAVVVALAFGLYRAATDGRFRGTRAVGGTGTGSNTADQPTTDDQGGEAPVTDSLLAGTPWESDLGERATLLQFSSAFCAPCRATRRVLEDVAGSTDGVAHVEVDAESHLDVVRRLGITRTPTTLVLDAAGRELVRAAGAPTRAQVESALPATPHA
ncbi:MAG: thiol reductase thioredoxin [Nocardioides sp.]|nr:thiol reductase thioredoxin [Nocardioides sp.]